MDDVSKFLQDVKEMNARRTEEDNARQRELDEKIQQEKRERQARRAERARSISPQKSSPANTPPTSSHRNHAHLTEDLRLSPAPDITGSPRSRDLGSFSRETSDRDSCGPAAAEQYTASPTDTDDKQPSGSMEAPSSPSGTMRSSRGMSWQRRPPSQASERSRAGSRPLSMVAAHNAARTSEPSSATDEVMSKDQIAQALGSKDPAWFRQTSERGANSAAYRKNQVEDQENIDMSSLRTQLPGMNRSPSAEPFGSPGTDNERQRDDRFRIASPPSVQNAPKLDPPAASASPEDDSTHRGRQSPTLGSGRTSPNRPASPTKGMGGFVQSAMMKRSDSVKRWTVTSPPGLARADSVASNRNSMVGGSGHSRSRSRPTSMFRQQSATQRDQSTSRPTSSHENDAPEQQQQQQQPSRSASPSRTPAEGTIPALHPLDTAMEKDDDKVTPPTSPSKTMDPRRWSPTKSSWLESALNKPESPKPKPSAPTSNQPAWLVELNKAKAQRAGNPEETRASRTGSVSARHEVNIGGLMRSSPMGGTPKAAPSPGLGGIYSPSPQQRLGNATTSGGSYRRNPSKDSIIVEKPELKPKPELQPQVRAAAEREPETEVQPEAAPAPATEPEPTPDVTGPSAGPSLSSSSPAAGKPKPEAPPKKDFRANLKARQPSGDSNASQGAGNEVQNVLGTLRRTQTKNYVAPDELKNNILRGKAGLNVTGGPQPSQRRDEFKEAILKKKGDFQKAQAEGKGVSHQAKPAVEKQVPEGLARRIELNKSQIGRKDPAAGYAIEPTSKLEQRPSSSVSQRSSAESVPKAGPSADAPPMPSLSKEESAPGRLQGRPSAGRLADRFNPGLAGLLAKGPPGMATNGGDKGPGETETKPSAPQTTEPSAPGPQLTHMTKGRARGPRRKAPTSATPAVKDKKPAPAAKENAPSPKAAAARVSPPVQSPAPLTTKSPAHDATPIKQAGSPKSSPPPTSPSSSLPQSIQAQVAAKAAAKSKPSPLRPSERPLPEPPSGRPLPEPMTPSTKASEAASQASKEPQPGNTTPFGTLRRAPSPVKSAPVEEAAAPAEASPRKLNMNRISRFMDDSNSQAPSPRQSPKKEEPSQEAASPAPLGSPKKEEPQPEVASPAPARSPKKPGNEVSAVLDDFFGTPRPRREYNIDTTEILMNRPRPAKINTGGAQLLQLSGDGKKMPVSPHNERSLFEQDMYLCPHDYAAEDGQKVSELYFWIGDEVSQPVAEDAQLFASREARALGKKLVQIRQGKETPEFLQALGGVVTTRRGSGNKYDSLAPSMLCGRRYLGQVVFDEVDFSPANLCSGFPFLVAQGGNCFLWKGKGSDVDELSCARLIGMDLTLTGELIEVDDGAESDAFWAAFEAGGSPSASKPHSADHWRLKPKYEKYSGRLFCSDASSPKQIIEVCPFSQSDLSPSNIYVLDAFFEMYIIVGRAAQSQYASFRNALDFAQEYAILASGMEDRPFVPIATVVLEGIPRDLKRVFRKWDTNSSPTILPSAQQGGGGTPLKRGRSLRVVSLTQALQAMSE